MTLITKSVDAVEMIAAHLEKNAGPLGIKYVGKFDERRIPQYPAVVVVPAGRSKVPHDTGNFKVEFEVNIYVYHADLTLTKRERSKADLQLVADIEESLEQDYGWTDDNGRRVIFGYIADETPGVLQSRSNKSTVIISTCITWVAESRRRLK